ncbi:MAG: helix-turn-helix transcriptional regulator [Candidatus Dormibacteraeota bacterium]|jgi:transcriptional regulator with XRE-family HTH domain|nr:helix-turn-helix transcriptional regulator [Candidatus Dormibacteraeota bacterium]
MASNGADRDALAFGTRIQDLRRQAGLTQRQVAEKLGIDFTYLSKVENSRGAPPGEDTIRRMAQLFSSDPDELLALAGKVPAELRERAVEDRQFARFLRTLPLLPDDVLQKLYRDAGTSPKRGRQ